MSKTSSSMVNHWILLCKRSIAMSVLFVVGLCTTLAQGGSAAIHSRRILLQNRCAHIDVTQDLIKKWETRFASEKAKGGFLLPATTASDPAVADAAMRLATRFPQLASPKASEIIKALNAAQDQDLMAIDRLLAAVPAEVGTETIINSRARLAALFADSFDPFDSVRKSCIERILTNWETLCIRAGVIDRVVYANDLWNVCVDDYSFIPHALRILPIIDSSFDANLIRFKTSLSDHRQSIRRELDNIAKPLELKPLPPPKYGAWYDKERNRK